MRTPIKISKIAEYLNVSHARLQMAFKKNWIPLEGRGQWVSDEALEFVIKTYL